MWFLIFLIAVAVTVALILLVVHLLGRALPPEHTAHGEIVLSADQSRVYGILADVVNSPAWSPITVVQPLKPDDQGRERWTVRQGRHAFEITILEHTPTTRLVHQLRDERNVFGGTWTISLSTPTPTPTSTPPHTQTRVTITEQGWIRVPIFRFIMAKFLDPSANLRAHLDALAKHLGQQATSRRIDAV